MFRFAGKVFPPRRKSHQTQVSRSSASSGSAGFHQAAEPVSYIEEDDPFDDFRIVHSLQPGANVAGHMDASGELDEIDMSAWVEMSMPDEVDMSDWVEVAESDLLQERDKGTDVADSGSPPDLFELRQFNQTILEGGSPDATTGHMHPAVNQAAQARNLSGSTNEHYARWSFSVVRDTFRSGGVRSGNKFRKGDARSIHRLLAAMATVPAVQSAIYRNTPTDYSPALFARAGNCQEMAGAAAQLIVSNGGQGTVYAVDYQGSHAFTLVGRVPASAQDHVGLQDYEDCWVVDPWAGLVCPAQDYCHAFDQKMAKWAGQHKALSWNNEWIEPTDPHWLLAVMNGPKHPVAAQPAPSLAPFQA